MNFQVIDPDLQGEITVDGVCRTTLIDDQAFETEGRAYEALLALGLFSGKRIMAGSTFRDYVRFQLCEKANALFENYTDMYNMIYRAT